MESWIKNTNAQAHKCQVGLFCSSKTQADQ